MQAVIYTRGSTNGQENTHGAQITQCMQWVAQQGLQLKSVHSEKISGGANLNKRKALIEAINDLSEGDLLVVAKRDRFGRNVVEVRTAEAQVRAKGAKVYSLETGYNETNPQQLQTGIIDLLSENERHRISMRTKEVMQHLISKGRFTGRAPMGFTVEIREDGKKYLTPDSTERDHLDLVRTWRAQGLNSKEIRALCVERGITSRDGGVPSQATISRWTKGVDVPKKVKAERKVSNPNLLGRRARPRLEDQLVGLLPLIKSLLAQGMSHAKITKAVDEAGYRTSTGKAIYKSQITAIISRNKD